MDDTWLNILLSLGQYILHLIAFYYICARIDHYFKTLQDILEGVLRLLDQVGQYLRADRQSLFGKL